MASGRTVRGSSSAENQNSKKLKNAVGCKHSQVVLKHNDECVEECGSCLAWFHGTCVGITGDGLKFLETQGIHCMYL